MNNKKMTLLIFILVAMAQLYMPAKVIYDQENLLNTGTEFKFKVAPIDPNDPFRGKYIIVYFEANTIEVENTDEWNSNEMVYINLATDNKGFAMIAGYSREKPQKGHFLKVKVRHTVTTAKKNLIIEYPFERFYMEESKAATSEIIYNKSATDGSQIAYALVNVKKGEGIIKDIIINGMPIRNLAAKSSNYNK